jgi:hypothetical protein
MSDWRTAFGLCAELRLQVSFKYGFSSEDVFR